MELQCMLVVLIAERLRVGGGIKSLEGQKQPLGLLHLQCQPQWLLSGPLLLLQKPVFGVAKRNRQQC